MTDNNQPTFAELMGKQVKTIQNDKVVHKPKPKTKTQLQQTKNNQALDIYFSDSYVPMLPTEGPMRYTREGSSPYEVKKLRRGDYYPEITLDLHGLNQQQAKKEIVALIAMAKNEQLECCAITHGVSGGVLKNQVPIWLAQHPDVIAFHQAPLEHGGHGALLLLVDIGEQKDPF
ncbi:endonuclease SmrB [Paraferrimonas sp. SM1919]|uniref:endonuclease SmrB n=1 Tax=Paraferrimonas sp. SM1919 TaxID=2662263 RepID=UPI0013D20430|nr:endonuclease SmrB [Paraferrimonas sp. SM1919]